MSRILLRYLCHFVWLSPLCRSHVLLIRCAFLSHTFNPTGPDIRLFLRSAREMSSFIAEPLCAIPRVLVLAFSVSNSQHLLQRISGQEKKRSGCTFLLLLLILLVLLALPTSLNVFCFVLLSAHSCAEISSATFILQTCLRPFWRDTSKYRCLEV